MKFEYEGSRDDRECVAYLHSSGSLMFSARGTYDRYGQEQGVVSIGGRYENTSFASPNGTATLNEVIQNDVGRGHKFYPGDKITITF